MAPTILLQSMLVGIIVAFCVVFSAWRLMSPKLRLKTLELIAPTVAKLGAGAWVTRLRGQTVAQLAAGCSACSNNKTAVHQPGRR
jgi:hypothetical protein